jgi:hypothetical protein
MNPGRKIKTVILEEHNEAFLVWNYAIKNKIINPEKNTLLHIDEHADMNAPRVKTSIFDVNNNTDNLIEFTYKELPINSFIVPAIFQGIFNRINWIQNCQFKSAVYRQKRCVRTFNNEGKKFIIYNPNNIPTDMNMNVKKFNFCHTSIENLSIVDHHNIVLDINLSYFCSVSDPNEYKVNYIQITENEYNEFVENYRYHNLKYEFFGHRIDVKKENGNYFYIINDHEEIYSFKSKTKDTAIVNLIQKFVDKLASYNLTPKIITITRGLKSGYTPEDKIELIERELINNLKRIYNLNILHIDDLLFSMGKTELNKLPEYV